MARSWRPYSECRGYGLSKISQRGRLGRDSTPCPIVTGLGWSPPPDRHPGTHVGEDWSPLAALSLWRGSQPLWPVSTEHACAFMRFARAVTLGP